MPAPGKRPDERGRRAIRLAPGRPGRPGPAWGVFQARGRRSGDQPEALRGRDPPGARRTGEPALEVRGPGAGGAIGRSASACPWRRSVSARRADPPTASTSARRSSGPVLGLRRPDRVGVQDRPRPLDSRRPVLPALPGCSRKAAPGSRGDPRPRGPSRSTRHWDPRRPGGCRAPGRRAPGGPVRRGWGACGRRSLTGAGPGRTVHTTGPAKGNPVPGDLLHRDFTAARPNRRWVVDFTHVPTRHGVPRCTAFVTGPVRDGRIVGRGHQHAHGAPGRGQRPGTGDPGRASTATAASPRRPGAPQRPRIQVTCPSLTPDDSSTRAPVASAEAVGSSLRRHRRPGPGQAPASAGPVLARRPPRDRDDPPGPQPPAG